MEQPPPTNAAELQHARSQVHQTALTQAGLPVGGQSNEPRTPDVMPLPEYRYQVLPPQKKLSDTTHGLSRITPTPSVRSPYIAQMGNHYIATPVKPEDWVTALPDVKINPVLNRWVPNGAHMSADNYAGYVQQYKRRRI